MGKSGGGGGGGYSVIMFAPYIEQAHFSLLNGQSADRLTLSCFAALNAAFNQSPYLTITTPEPDDGFLGGINVLSYPALFRVYQDKMFGIDTEELWETLNQKSISGTILQQAVSSQSEILEREMEATLLPKMKAGFRDINAVQSSTFVIAKALLAREKMNSLADYASKLQIHQLDMAQARWEGTLNWNKSITASYGDAIKMYYSARFDADNREMEFKVKDKLWNLSLFEYGRSMVAALNGAPAAKPDLQPSQAAKSISMAAAGAGAGASLASMIGQSPTAGAAVGGVLGLASSFM